MLLFCNCSGQAEKDAKPLPRINRHSVFWIVASISVTYYVDFFHNIMENDDIKRWLCYEEDTKLSITDLVHVFSTPYIINTQK